MRWSCCLWIASLALSGLLLTGCRTASTAKSSPGTNSADKVSARQKVEDDALARRAEAFAHYGTGVIHDLNNEKDAALEEFSQAALNDPDNEALTLEISWRLLENKQTEKALELLQSAVKRPNASGAIYARLGLIFTGLERNEEAIAASQLAIKKSPRALAGYRNLLFNYLKAKQPAAALNMLDQAAKQPNADAGFLVGLAGLYANYLQQFPSQRQAVNAKVMVVLERAEKLKDPGAHLRLQLADGFFLAGNMEKAAVHYLAVLDQLTDLPQARDLVRERLAKIYLREGDRKGAVKQLEVLMHDDPANAQAYYYLGLIAHDEQRWADAVDHLRKTLLFSPNFEQAYYDLAMAQIAANQADEALATLGTAGTKFPQNFKLDYVLGMAHDQVKNYAEAVKHFSRAELIAQTGNAKLLTHIFYVQAGEASERNGDHARAKDYFEKAIKLQPDFEPAYYDLANTLIGSGRADEALAILETAKKQFAENFLREYLFGAVYRQQKNYPEAIRYFTAAEVIAQAKETNRLTHFFYFDVGAVFERSGDRGQAEKYFQKCLKLEPDFHEAQNYLGYMWAERGENLGQARELIEQALKAQPENGAYLDSMGWVLFKQGQPKAALDYLLKAAKFTKEPDATLYDHLGDVYAALNEMEKAREAWRKSLSVEKSDAVQKKLEAPKK